MPSVLKRRGVLPALDSVAIPDIDFGRQPEQQAGSDMPDFCEEKQADSFMAEDVQETLTAPPQAQEPCVPIFTPQELAEYYSDDLASLQREATEQAYQDAFREKRGELQQSLTHVEETLSEMQRLQDDFMLRYSDSIKYTALEIAEKFVDQKIAADDSILLRLVTQTVAAVKGGGWLNVEVSDRLVHLISQIREQLSDPKYQGKASITPVSGEIGTCRVSNDEGALDSSISVQAENLRRVFKAMKND